MSERETDRQKTDRCVSMHKAIAAGRTALSPFTYRERMHASPKAALYRCPFCQQTVARFIEKPRPAQEEDTDRDDTHAAALDRIHNERA